MMLKSIWNRLRNGSGFESYYLNVLAHSGSETAPSASEARRDYMRGIQNYQRYY